MAKKSGGAGAVGGPGKGFQGSGGGQSDMCIKTQDASRKLKGPSVNTGATNKDNSGFQKPLGPRVA